MAFYIYTQLAIYVPEPDDTKEKIGDAWIIKIGPCVVGLFWCRGDYYPGMLYENGSIPRHILQYLPWLKRITPHPLIVQRRPDVRKRHWVMLFASTRSSSS